VRFEPREATPQQLERIHSADEALRREPAEVERIIEAALAREEVWRYGEAVDLYSRGIRIAPRDYRLLLGRAHRLIRLRRPDEALTDLARAVQLDPYGFNSAYLRGLVYYLTGRFDQAAQEYARCAALAEDPVALELAMRGEAPGDPRHCMLIASDIRTRAAITAWRWRALMRAGRDAEAARVLEWVQPGIVMDEPSADEYEGSLIRPGSNRHYYETLLLYRGFMDGEDLLDREKWGGQWPTVGYGVAVWHLTRSDTARAIALIREIAHSPEWARLGHVAAEADLLRLERRESDPGS
jgi:tetratricopeptide (TPR) repeat protein